MSEETISERGALTAVQLVRRITGLGSPEKARLLMRFFKTGPGQYGEGDMFAGLTVPEIRSMAREYRGLPLRETVELLRSPVHEARLLALILLIQEYRNGDSALKSRIYGIYLENTMHINNWDLVDASAEHIIGAHVFGKSRELLYRLAVSDLLWERRIAIIATFFFIKSGSFEDTLRIAEMLLPDREDLIHKAVGWMLREVGKRDRAAEEAFLSRHYRNMPRTMLRYAIEKFPEQLRQKYLKGLIRPKRN